jgi:peptidoglycan/LPS O-acetylase OafA/YrhL
MLPHDMVPAVMRHSFMVLDAFRGIAAAAVATVHAPLFFHTVATYGSVPDASGRLPVTGPLFEAYLGVDFFFQLSGFVLAYAYNEKLNSGLGPWRFMRIRLIRFYPLYILALAIMLWPATHIRAIPVTAGTVSVQTLTALVFLPSPLTDGEGNLFPLNVPVWSLFFELIVNFLFALLVPLLTFARLFALVVLGATILVCAVVFHWFTFGTSGFGAMPEGFAWPGFGAGFLRAFYGFFCGALCYGLFQRFSWRGYVTPLLPCAALILILATHPPVAWQALYDFTAVLVLFPLLILVGASISKPRYVLASQFLGAASYGVYVLQVPLYVALIYALRTILGLRLDSLPFWTGMSFVAFVFLIAYAAYCFYDVPVRRWLAEQCMRPRLRGHHGDGAAKPLENPADTDYDLMNADQK